MPRAELQKVAEENFAIVPDESTENIKVIFSGNADMAALNPLEAFLKQLQTVVRVSGTRQVECDFRELYFMNSSCFKQFVVWIGTLVDLDPNHRCYVTFRSNPNLHWQSRSLESLRCFGPEVVTVDSGMS